jgi:hypothetical protein
LALGWIEVRTGSAAELLVALFELVGGTLAEPVPLTCALPQPTKTTVAVSAHVVVARQRNVGIVMSLIMHHVTETGLTKEDGDWWRSSPVT